MGGGPAGAAAAVVLARAGLRVALFERSAYDADRIGETLPPEIRLPLQRLGAWDRFCAAGHTPSPGIVAVWGQAEPYANDFVWNPYGPGWRVDRRRFDAMLATAAEEAGAVVRRRTGVVGCRRATSRGWDLTTSSGSSVTAGLVIDATGRASALRRAVGARRVVDDRLVALVAVVPAAVGIAAAERDRDRDGRALVEATEHGWWYSAGLPDGRLVLSFQTDAGPGLRTAWAEHLARGPLTAARAALAGPVRPGDVGAVAANSQRREPVAGDGWLAAGDAASAHDPLAGRGVHWALESGMAAAEAVIARTVGGDEGAVARYAGDTWARYEAYLSARAAYYGLEQRWPDAPFWRRRHA